MASDIWAQVEALVAPLPQIRGFLSQPPISWQTALVNQHEDDFSALGAGKYDNASGAIKGQWTPKMQDTVLSTTTGNRTPTKRVFSATAGTWDDTFVHPEMNLYGLLQPDNSPAAVGTILADSSTAGIEPALFVIRRDLPPGGAGSQHTKEENYLYLYLCWNDARLDYRLACSWQQPIRIESSTDKWATTYPIKVFKELGSFEDYMVGRHGELRLSVVTDKKRGIVSFRIGNDPQCTHQPKLASVNGLPETGRPRLLSKNGGVGFLYLPLRAGNAQIQSATRDFGATLPRLGEAVLNGNALGLAPDAMTATYQVQSPDGRKVSYKVNATIPDVGAGDPGGDQSPLLSDANLVVPAEWVTVLPGPPAPLPPLLVKRYEEEQVYDDISRIYATQGSLLLENQNRLYQGMYGRRWVEVNTSNGGPFGVRLTGVVGGGDQGWCIHRGPTDTPRDCTVRVTDFVPTLQVPLGFEQNLDGMYLGTAVRMLCEAGNIHPQFLARGEWLDFDYVPPGCSPDAPYGPAGEDLPPDAFILPRGFGNEPRYRILPGVSPWQALLMLVQDAAKIDPNTGDEIPCIMGFDGLGKFHFYPYDPTFAPASYLYSTVPESTGGVPISGPVHVFNSVEQMRSHVDFEGLDAVTYELLYYHLPTDPEVWKAMGHRYAWFERSPKFVEGDYMMHLANRAAMQASLPQTVCSFGSIHVPGLRASMVIDVVSEDLPGGGMRMVVTRISSVLDGRSGEASSVVTCRALYNFF